MNDYPMIAFPCEISSEYQERLQNDPEFAKFIADAKRQQELMRPFYEAEMREEEERAERMKYIMEYFKNRGKQKEWLTEMKKEREMNKQKTFNIGDRVRFTRDYDNECVCVDKGDCGTIERIDANGILITLDNPEYVRIFDMDYIEPITPIAPKTAFLSDLAAVLRKHNAEIIGGGFDGYGDYLQVRLGNESPFDVGEDNQYDGVVLTADNIMDLNKE